MKTITTLKRILVFILCVSMIAGMFSMNVAAINEGDVICTTPEHRHDASCETESCVDACYEKHSHSDYRCYEKHSHSAEKGCPTHVCLEDASTCDIHLHDEWCFWGCNYEDNSCIKQFDCSVTKDLTCGKEEGEIVGTKKNHLSNHYICGKTEHTHNEKDGCYFKQKYALHLDIHIELIATYTLDGVPYTETVSLSKADFDNGSLVITGGSGLYTNGTSDPGQLRFHGTLPVGTSTDPVYYNIRFVKDVTFDEVPGEPVTIPMTFQRTVHFWSESNICETLRQNSNNLSKWNKGEYVSIGMDFKLGATATGTTEPAKKTLTIQKEISGIELTETQTVNFKVYDSSNALVDTVSVTVPAGQTTAIGTTALPVDDTYYVVESGDYSVDGYTLTTSHSVNGADGSGTTTESFSMTNDTAVVFTNAYTTIPTTGSLTITKSTVGEVATPASAVFTVTGPNGYSKTLNYSEFTGGSYTISDLAPGEYSVTESGAAVDGYTLTVSENNTATVIAGEAAAVTVTNTYDEYIAPPPATVDISGSKTWDDGNDQDGIRPESITVNLLADGEVVESKAVTAADNWAYSFTGMLKYNNGAEIVYTVSEDAVPGYTATVSGYNITNSHTPETVNVSGAKTWNDRDNEYKLRPESITVNLLADGEVVDSKTVTAADNWAYSFIGLAKYANGKEIAYTVTENAVANYTATVNGYDITNSLNSVTESGDPQLPTLTITKVDAATGAKLEGAVFTLSGTYTMTATSNSNGIAVFANIPVGEYTLSETSAPAKYDRTTETWKVEVTAEKNGYTISVGDDGIINKVWNWVVGLFVSGKNSEELTVENSLSYVPKHTLGSITVTKVSTGATTPATATFTLSGPNGYSQSLIYSDILEGKNSFTGLEAGTYTLTESGADVADYTLASSVSEAVTLEVTVADNGDTSVGSGNITVTNVYTPVYVPTNTLGYITITKDSTGATTPATATFTLSGPNGYSQSLTYAEVLAGNNTFADLAEGTYTLTETGADVADFTLVSSVSGPVTLAKTVADNGDTSVGNGSITVTNVYTPVYVPTHTLGSITVSKESVGATTPATAVFTLNGPNGYSQTLTYADILAGKNSFSDLAEGTYSLTETGADVNGYTLVSSVSGSVTLAKTVANNGDTSVGSGSVTVTNTYTAITPPAPPIIIVPDPEPETYSISYSVTGDEPATFTVSPVSSLNEDEVEAGTVKTVAAELTTTETAKGDVEGTWTFSGWTTADATVADGSFEMPKQDVAFVGSWTFVETAVIPDPEIPLDPEPTPTPDPEPTPDVTPEPTPDPEPPVEIPDDDVPLVPVPDPWVEIEDEEVPLSDIPDEDPPRTGDPSSIYAAICAVSGVGVLGLSIFGKKKEEDEEENN